MRSSVLDPFFKSVAGLPGVGPKTAKLLSNLGIELVIDLLFHLPVSMIDRTERALVPGKVCTTEVMISMHHAAPRKGVPHRVDAMTTDGVPITLTFFHAKGDYLQNMLPPGEKRFVSGKIEQYGKAFQMVHPDYMTRSLDDIPLLDPIYPLTAGITSKTLHKLIASALPDIPDLHEWQSEAVISFKMALETVHSPVQAEDFLSAAPARIRLAYDELLANQLALLLVREKHRKQPGVRIKGDGKLCRETLASLPFELTSAQKAALRDIFGDMASEHRMLRMLQGDVGSGKTVVALFAMLNASETGAQSCLMAPTDILARQHFETICKLSKIPAVLLTGKDKGKKREEILEKIASGEVLLVVGTHALFQDSVVFKNLKLAIVDEQHKFGVHQRLLLSEKGEAVDMLVLSATPIPRTLCLTAYGDMDITRLSEKPKNRQPIQTVAMPTDRMKDIVAALKRAMDEGQKIYWICPLVEESEKIDLAAAEERFDDLKKIFPDHVGLIHGRMKADEKESVMQDFLEGKIRILVATTVVEVGVDVKDATIMVIEHAERFGLAQLHQLRGRVGRSELKSTCMLLYKAPLSSTAQRRIDVMRNTNDGFLIAEEDLILRGEGDLIGLKQSGFPEMKLANLLEQRDLLQSARKESVLILNKDNHLSSERGQALKNLLALFQKETALRNIRAG